MVEPPRRSACRHAGAAPPRFDTRPGQRCVRRHVGRQAAEVARWWSLHEDLHAATQALDELAWELHVATQVPAQLVGLAAACERRRRLGWCGPGSGPAGALGEGLAGAACCHAGACSASWAGSCMRTAAKTWLVRAWQWPRWCPWRGPCRVARQGPCHGVLSSPARILPGVLWLSSERILPRTVVF